MTKSNIIKLAAVAATTQDQTEAAEAEQLDAERALLEMKLTPLRGQSDYAAFASICLLNSNSMGLT